MDVVSDVLLLLNALATFTASLTTGGDWAITLPRHPGLKFGAVIRGSCWLVADDLAHPIELHPGDCYLLALPGPYKMASDLALEPVDARAIYADFADGKAQYGTEHDSLLLGGRFSFDHDQISILLDILPLFIHIKAGSQHASNIPWMLERLSEEVSSAEAGASLMLDHLAHMLFVQVLRAYLASGETMPVGWLGALADERIGLALNLMHTSPGQRWTLAQLTKATGMSRSAFSARFKKLVGTGPLDYLLRWRMQLAAKALRQGSKSLAEIAFSLGYESESAFANAFKRVMGKAPGRYQREVRVNIIS